MKLLLVAGARPNFMKIAPIVAAIHAYEQSSRHLVDYILVHTGQHYDDKMSDGFFKDLGIPQPTVNLEVGSGPHAVQTAEIMKRFEPVLLQEQPDAIVVVGDVNSTIACSLVASKVSYQSSTQRSGLNRPMLVHVEAGLRSGDWSMPEEINRVLTDVLADVLFITETSALKNLRREGISKERIHFVGNTMVDTLLKYRERALESTILQRLGLFGGETTPAMMPAKARTNSAKATSTGPAEYALVTLHRPSNVDERETFQEILEALVSISKTLPVVFPIHPRTITRIKEFGFDTQCRTLAPHEQVERGRPVLHCIEPLGYLDFLCLMSHARLVLTDSGGIQEETTMLGVPCVTLRHNTERPVTVTLGTNVLAGTRRSSIVACAMKKLRHPARARRPRLWDGRAGERIVRILVREVLRRQARQSKCLVSVG